VQVCVLSLLSAAALLAACGSSGRTATVDGTVYHGISNAAGNKLYDDAYRECWGEQLRDEGDVAAEFGGQGKPEYEIARRGCRAANGDIAACVPPIYYTPGDAYWCDEGSGRRLKQP
jgi:hypothetical protein